VSNQANIRDIQILGDLKAAFGCFGEDVLQVLVSLEKQFEEIQERLEERQEHWQRQVDVAQEAVYDARRSLNECESGPDDDEGNSPDCSSEAEQVSDAERDLDRYEENLETVKQWRHRIEGQIADFENDMHRLSNLASSNTSSVQAFLATKIEILDRYVGGSSAGMGISGLQSRGGNDNIAFREGLGELTSVEKEALLEYTGPGYFQINGTLRLGVSDEAVLKKANLISQSLTKFPIHTGTVYRRVPSGRYTSKYIPGDTVEEAGFTSASKSKNPPLGGNVFFTIKSKTGRDISSFAENKREEEVLFDRGTRFKIVSRTMIKHAIEIEMEEL
jgi:hypothetical protein